MARTVLITGAAGRIGGHLRTRMARPGRVLRLLDAKPVPGPRSAEEIIEGDLTDPDTMVRACAGVTAVIHLGGIAFEDEWDRLLHANVNGTRVVLESAQRAGIPRVLLASSIHAAGFYRRAGTTGAPAGFPAPDGPDGVPATASPRPDTYYGVTKAAMEGLGSLYADRYGMTVVAVRIGACFPEPKGDWALDSWLSPDDCGRLMEAFLSTDATGFHVVWGVSRNADRWWSLQEGAAIGFDPQDDAAKYEGLVLPTDEEKAETDGLLGKTFATVPLGVPMP